MTVKDWEKKWLDRNHVEITHDGRSVTNVDEKTARWNDGAVAENVFAGDLLRTTAILIGRLNDEGLDAPEYKAEILTAIRDTWYNIRDLSVKENDGA